MDFGDEDESGRETRGRLNVSRIIASHDFVRRYLSLKIMWKDST